MTKRIFKTKAFARWLKKAGLANAELIEAVAQIERGQIDANLGGNVFKQRIPKDGKGKGGSARAILVTNLNSRWFFISGFEKKDLGNLAPDELAAAKESAKLLLALAPTTLTQMLTDKSLEEIQP